MREGLAMRDQKEVFTSYVLQFKRFSRLRKSIENEAAEGVTTDPEWTLGCHSVGYLKLGGVVGKK